LKALRIAILLVISIQASGQVPDFTLTNVADVNHISLSNFESPVAVIFLSNDCAFDNYYAARLNLLIESYSGKVQFLLINSGVEPSEANDRMLVKYSAWGYRAPYLADKEQVVMNIFNARKTPEAFLLKRSGGGFSIAFQGPIDDNPQVATDVKQNYLKEAIDRLLSNKKIEAAEIRPNGCTIRKK